MQKRIFRFFVTAILVGLFGVSPISAQTETRVFVEEINTEAFPQSAVYVSVLDGQGFPIEDLNQDNFSVQEDGTAIGNFDLSLEDNTNQKISFVLAIDTSGSMAYKPDVAINDAIQAAVEFVDNLPANDDVGLVAFGGQEDDGVLVVQEVTNDHNLVRNSILELEANGKNTFLYDGLIASIEALQHTKSHRVIILITDGLDSDVGAYTYEDVVNDAIKKSTPIYTLGFGSVDEDELSRIATITGGVAQINPSADSLSDGFKQIMDILRKQYVLRFESTLPANNQTHKLSVSVDYLDETYTSEKEFTIDTAPRILISFDSPLEGDTLKSSQDIAVSVDSKYKIEELSFTVNGESLAIFNSEPYTFQWELYDVKNGKYTISAEARDEMGLTHTEEIVVTVSQSVADGGTEGDTPMGSLGIYLIIGLFLVLLIVIVTIGLRKRKNNTDIPDERVTASGFVLVEIKGRNPNKVWGLDMFEVRLGRKSDVNDIPLEGSKASRQMALIQNHQGEHTIYSVKPENPVIVNDVPIQHDAVLKSGDIITLGDSVFRYENQGDA